MSTWNFILTKYLNEILLPIGEKAHINWIKDNLAKTGISFLERIYLLISAEFFSLKIDSDLNNSIVCWFLNAEAKRRHLPKLSHDFFAIMWIYRKAWAVFEIDKNNKLSGTISLAYRVIKNSNPRAWLEQKWTVNNDETQNILDELEKFCEFKESLSL